MKWSIIIQFLCVIFITSCTTSKPLTYGVYPAEITDLKLLEPHSYISMIKKGNRGELDDSLSLMSRQRIPKVLNQFRGQIPITDEITLSDSIINSNLDKEFEALILPAERNKNISDLKITPDLDKILEANNARFGLLIVSSGFTRVKGNYGKQVAKGAGLAILTLGMYYQTPIKAYSILHVMIVDSKEDNVVFYRKSFLQDKEPLDESVLTRQFRDIFKGYFIPSK